MSFESLGLACRGAQSNKRRDMLNQLPPPASSYPALMTTAEVAEFLRTKERTIYDMVAKQAIPFTRATGKLLFPRRLIEAWLEAQTETPETGAWSIPQIYSGSNDPLLDWALRYSKAGLAVRSGDSTRGLDDLAAGKAMLAGLHLFDPVSDSWNVQAVRNVLSSQSFVLVHWARRTQGLLVAPGNPHDVASLRDCVELGLRFALRSEGSGTQRLLDIQLSRSGLSMADLNIVPGTAHTHADLAIMIETGAADCGLGIQAASGALGFVPMLEDDQFDLAMPRRAYFEAPVQNLMTFARSPEFAAQAARLGGYDLSDLGRVVWNG